MPTPNSGLITETNRQYYEGAQGFISLLAQTQYTTTFNTDLVFGSWDPAVAEYALNNFKLYHSPTGLPGTFNEYLLPYSVSNNIITLGTSLAANEYVVVQLKTLDGGLYANPSDPGSYAYGTTTEENYGSYAYIKLNDIINNFMVAYVGQDKLIANVKRTDVIFHAKRSLQEFSYDTLRSIKSQELSIPPSLSLVLPQDYVNYVKISWIDRAGVKHPIYPTNNLTIAPYESLLQDTQGVPMQDTFGSNVETESITEKRWKNNDLYLANNNIDQSWGDYGYGYDNWLWYGYFGQRYGMEPQYSNDNGYFTINDREGKISFSSGMVGKLVVIEYISDGLAYDLDTKVPKLAEEAMYAHIIHAIISLRINQPEYIVQRLKQEKNAKLRNAKIRLSNIKLEEITQVLRGQSKWIKH
jgi:hypothetical protein